jgi:hypothetical protein
MNIEDLLKGLEELSNEINTRDCDKMLLNSAIDMLQQHKSEPKSIFQKMHILNQMDEQNKTKHCGIFNQLVSADMVKAGGHVTMGVDRETFMEIALDPEKRAVLLIAIDREQLDAIK